MGDIGRPLRLRSLLAPVSVISLIVIASAFACYGPTEVTVALSTDLGCTDPIQTAIYKGDRGTFSPEAAAETSACTQGQGTPDSQIGTLVFLPSGDRNGDVSVKAVLTKNKKPPGLCDSDPTDCIIATRSFAFVEHTSRRVPIRLLKTCLGVKCGPGETCGPNGTCISNRVDCSSTSCDLDPNIDGGPPPSNGDGGGNPTDGGGIRDASDLRCVLSNDSDVLIGNVPMPEVAGATATSLLWAAPSVKKPGGSALWSIPKVGGVASELTTFDTQQVVALGLSSGNDPMLGHGSNTQWNVRFSQASSESGLFGAPPSAPVALVGNGTFFIGSSANDLRVWDENDQRFVVKITNPAASGIQTFARVPTLGSQVIGGGTAGVWISGPALGTGGSSTKIDFKLVNGSPTNAIVAASTTQLFAAGKSGNTHGLIEITGDFSSTSLKLINDALGPVSPTSLGADAVHVYGTINNTIVRWPLSAKASETIVTEIEPIRHVAVDSSCVYYWVGSEVTDGIGSLKVHPKGPRVKPAQP